MAAYPVLTAAIALEDYRLLLVYDESEKRVYDFKPNLSHKFYSALADKRLLKTFPWRTARLHGLRARIFVPIRFMIGAFRLKSTRAGAYNSIFS